jgi:hypothetical protein
MTVCIAAICQDGTALVLAADRMITSGTGNETEFEIPGLSREAPKAPVLKLVPLNQHIIAMTAGNACFQAAAIQHLFTQLKDTRINDGSRVFSSIPVRDVAAYYVDYCNDQRRIATDVFLSPYGLNTTSYIDKQKSLSDRFVVSISDEVESIRDRVGDPVLFCGIDEGGAHIFHSEGSTVSSCDPFAFAAIGSGGEHAESQFMLAGHTRLASVTDTNNADIRRQETFRSSARGGRTNGHVHPLHDEPGTILRDGPSN